MLYLHFLLMGMLRIFIFLRLSFLSLILFFLVYFGLIILLAAGEH